MSDIEPPPVTIGACQELVGRVRQAVGDTPLMVPGNLRDLLCASAYANDHVIALLLKDVAQNAIRAVLDGIAEPSEAMIEAAQRTDTLAARNRGAIVGRYRAMIAALRKEIAK